MEFHFFIVHKITYVCINTDRSNQKRIEANLISQSIVTMRRNTEQLCSRKSDESFDSFDNENEFKQRSTITKSSVGGQGIQNN